MNTGEALLLLLIVAKLHTHTLASNMKATNSKPTAISTYESHRLRENSLLHQRTDL